MIKAIDLVLLFLQALAEGWGYIWGKSGQVWTQACLCFAGSLLKQEKMSLNSLNGTCAVLTPIHLLLFFIVMEEHSEISIYKSVKAESDLHLLINSIT